jgi:hypothetical protein
MVSCIYNYLCNQSLSPLTLWARISLRRGVPDTTLCDKVCQLHTTGRWFSTGTPVSSINKSLNLPQRYICNIVESGVKHHKPKLNFAWIVKLYINNRDRLFLFSYNYYFFIHMPCFYLLRNMMMKWSVSPPWYYFVIYIHFISCW